MHYVTIQHKYHHTFGAQTDSLCNKDEFQIPYSLFNQTVRSLADIILFFPPPQVLTSMFFLHKFRSKQLTPTGFKAMGIKQVLKVNEVLNCFVEPRWTVALQVQ